MSPYTPDDFYALYFQCAFPTGIAHRVQQKRLDRTQICTNCPLLETTVVGELICRADIGERYMPDVRDIRTHCLTSAGYRVCPRFAEGSTFLS